MKKTFPILFSLFLFFSNGNAGHWFSINGSLARVEYQQQNKTLADSLLRIAEEALPRLAQFHGLPFGRLKAHRVRIILTDTPDISNGMAFGRAVVIYARSSMYMPNWTGNAPWYKTVLTHELAHYVTFLKIRRRLSVLGEAVNLTAPRWFFEGLAQYFAEHWNAYRGDLYLQNALLAGRLTYGALENLNDGRLLYAAANGYVRWLATTYGDSSLIKLLSYEEKGWYYDFDEAFKAVYKKTPETLFADFHRKLVLHYGSKLAAIPANKSVKKIPAFGYKDFQMLPLSAQDSTWLIVSQVDKNQRYKTALIAKMKNGAFKQLREISNNFTTAFFLSPRKRFAAYGRYHLSSAENQLGVRTDWFIYDIQKDKTVAAAKNVRARTAAFTPENKLVLAEIYPSRSRLTQFADGEAENILYQTTLAIGSFIILKDRSFVLSVQRKNGCRDLILIQNGQERAVTSDCVDDRDPLALNDSLLVFNRYQSGHPALAVYNFKTGRFRPVYIDRAPCFLEGKGRENALIAARWGSAREKHFFILPLDSLLEQETPQAIDPPHPELADWTRHRPAASATALPINQKPIRKRIWLPQFPLEHILSFALPEQEAGAGWGIYGTTIWMEALQRQSLAAVFLMFKKYDNSFLSIQHNLGIFNGQLLSTFYHGPVIFGFNGNAYLHLQQDVASVSWQRKYFIDGNPRFRLDATLSYAHHKSGAPDRNIKNAIWHGPGISARFQYLLPSRYYPALPKRQFSAGFGYSKSFDVQYNFSILRLSLTLASNIIREDVGFKNRTVYLKQAGEMPPYQTLGVDRFYEFDLPRDFIYTQPVRGLREDIRGNSLFWNSTDLIYLIDEKTGLKLISLPINNLSAQLFFDYALVRAQTDKTVYSYGGELSFGESLLRLGAGYAEAVHVTRQKSQTYYFRLSLTLP